MISLQDAAEYYENLGLWIVPDKVTDNFQNLSGAFTVHDISKYDWKDATSIKCVLAQKDIRAIVLKKFQDKSEKYNYIYLKKVLNKFGLKHYPWVIRTPDKFIIVVISGEKPNQNNIYTRAISLYLKGYLYLPFRDSSNQFYYNGIPTINPEYISIARLLRCFNEVSTEMRWADYFSEMWSFNDFVKLYGDLRELRSIKRNSDGKSFKLCVFNDDKQQTTASLYSGIEQMSLEDILSNSDELMVGKLLGTNRYTVFKDWEGWERVDLHEDLNINEPVPILWNNDPLHDLPIYLDIHGLWEDSNSNKDTPEDEAEMDKIWEEIRQLNERKEAKERKKAHDELVAKRNSEFLFDFSGDDLSLYPELQ